MNFLLIQAFFVLSIQELTGNKVHVLANTVRAQFVRIVVKEWYHHICLRMEFYGCQGKNVKISYAVIHIIFFGGRGGRGGKEASILAFLLSLT